MKPLTPHARKTKAYMAKAPARTAREELLFSQLAFVASVCEAWGKVVSETERPIVISMAKAVSLDNPKLRSLFESPPACVSRKFRLCRRCKKRKVAGPWLCEKCDGQVDVIRKKKGERLWGSFPSVASMQE